ncbi:hypothetical protein OH77DRAFT_1057200 [Trametes cingulata]|nr:hypothetical protein OH77DRAFT_1057200 [Trametes cingulata]
MAKGRWLGREVLEEVFIEFRGRSMKFYVSRMASARVRNHAYTLSYLPICLLEDARMSTFAIPKLRPRIRTMNSKVA